MRAVIAGASGLIGRALLRRWRDQARFRSLILLTRSPQRAAGRIPLPVEPTTASSPVQSEVRWLHWDDPAATAALQQADVIVNLAGATLARRWTPAYKQQILMSRVQATRRIVAALNAAPNPGAVLINASAVGYYGTDPERTFTEESKAGEGFLADVCARWEAAALAAKPVCGRVVLLRIGTVLAGEGGALPKMALPFRLGLGGPLGDGRQWISWIQLDDVCRMIDWIIETGAVAGPVNVVAPEPVRNEAFTQALAKTLRRPRRLRVPAILLRLAFGEMAGLLLEGQRVVPAVAEAHGFRFAYPTLEEALAAALLSRRTND